MGWQAGCGVQEPWVLGEGAQADFVEGPLVYINDTVTAYRLGCPADKCGCFFNFTRAALQAHALQPCQMHFRPLPADGGRTWCVCTVEEPHWLAEQHPKPWRHEKEALAMGTMTGLSAEILQSLLASVLPADPMAIPCIFGELEEPAFDSVTEQ